MFGVGEFNIRQKKKLATTEMLRMRFAVDYLCPTQWSYDVEDPAYK